MRAKSSDWTGLVLLFTLGVVPPSCVAEDWPRWGGPRGDETWRGPTLPEEWPKGGLRVVWKQPISGGFGGISVWGNRVYVQDRVKEPQEQERLLCFDADSGGLLWTHADDVAYGKLDYGNGPRATPTIHEGRVYTQGAVGRINCLAADSGTLRWTKNFPKTYGTMIPAPTWGLAASPVVWKNLVITHPGVEEGGCLIAFDRITGDEVWRASDDPAGYATPIIIDSPSGPQLVSWTPEQVLGIDPKTGKIFWSIPYKVTFGVSIATPIYCENRVFVTGYWEGSKSIELGPIATDAKLVWEDNRALRGLMAQPLYRGGYGYTIDKRFGLTCFDYASGKKLWDDGNRMTPRGDNPHATLVWLGDSDRVIILNAEGDLILARLNPDGYHEQSRTNIIAAAERAPIWAHPAYAGRRVYARSDTELVCVELPAVNED